MICDRNAVCSVLLSRLPAAATLALALILSGTAWADDEKDHDDRYRSDQICGDKDDERDDRDRSGRDCDNSDDEGKNDHGKPDPEANNPKNTFNIMMNYELGMHCTGFEFAYCCALPPYNSILAQVVKTQQSDTGEGAFAKLLEGDPNEGLDALERQTVLRDADLGPNGEFQKYVLEYWHDAQPRETRPQVVPQVSTLISAVEGNSLLMWNSLADSAGLNTDGSLKLSGQDGNAPWHGVTGAILGDGDYTDPDNPEPDLNDSTDNYWNAVWNHLYIYEGLEGENPHNSTAEADKIRLGVTGQIEYPTDCGAGLHPMGPVTSNGVPIGTDDKHPALTPNDCGGNSNGNVLTFSGEHGTVVYTQSKVLENLPITLTSPRIWEALGLPLTPFEDTINFFADPGAMFEDSVRPFVAMNARLHHYDPTEWGGMGEAVLQDDGMPVEGFGTAPIDIPNCERCHSNEAGVNSPHTDNPDVWSLVQQEYEFWMGYYGITEGDSDWYPRLKSAAISILALHDKNHGTEFTINYPVCTTPDECDALAAALSLPEEEGGLGRPVYTQSTRLGAESVICQRCHGDNVVAQVKSATAADGEVIKPMSEAVHHSHRGTGEGGPITFTDSLGRFGGCQGCHPAHRSDGDMEGYPITEEGDNFYASSDNRLGDGGCFVGRDVHSNPFKNIDGAGTPEHLNAIGQWLSDNVAYNQSGLAGEPEDYRGIWCTNCHNQLSQEIWKEENMVDLVHDVPGPDYTNIRALGSLEEIATAVGVSEKRAIDWLDPRYPNVTYEDGAIRQAEETMGIWREDPGLCEFLVNPQPEHDATLATVEVSIQGKNGACSTGQFLGPVDCSGVGGPVFEICGTYDGDGDFTVNILDLCTADDCVADAQAGLTSTTAVAVPFSAATDGRDHWLAAGEPHCADCHKAPYVEQSGHINAYSPFNYPRKAGLMRYSRGHRDITCQGCHESIHGLYPVAPDLDAGPGTSGVDSTSYAQAAYLNSDDSHGPLKCGSCHKYEQLDDGMDGQIPARVCAPGESSAICDQGPGLHYDGKPIFDDFDAAVSWAHTFTDEHDPRQDFCVSCHKDENNEVNPTEGEWLEHAMKGRVSRKTMDQVEILTTGEVFGSTNPRRTVCQGCHEDEWNEVSCDGDDGREWKLHLAEGRVAESVWVEVSKKRTGSTCGW